MNPLAGTASNDKLSNRNTLPIVARPWGFNHWAPASTLSNTAWWFHPDNTDFEGIRCTHQPSPWIGDWAWFLVSSSVGPHKYRPQAAELKPYLFSHDSDHTVIRLILHPQCMEVSCVFDFHLKILSQNKFS